ncbi:MAG: antibiotic biosynthesis monooxygenase [Chloroflexota bacterium]|nr:antibiotic biosynthesis monooxygenase [Chloroflexota bacterium]
MTAKVLIERKFRPESLGRLLELSLELRAMATKQPGHICGETLGSADHDNLHLVISTWRNLDDWKAWEQNPERIRISKQIDDLLIEPTKARVFIELWGS